MRNPLLAAPVPLAVLLLAGGGCGDSGPLAVALGQIEVQPTLEFGAVQVGQSRTLFLEVVNAGAGVLRVSDIAPDDNFVVEAYAFSIAERSFSVPPGQTRRVEVQFRPFAVGAAQARLTIVSDGLVAEGTPNPPSVVLSAVGVRTGIEVVPEPIDFGAVLAGSSRTLEVQVNNRLPTPVELFTAVDADGAPRIVNREGRGRFEVLSPEPDAQGSLTAGALIDPGDGIRVQLRYIPEPSRLDGVDRARWIVRNCDASLCDKPVDVVGRGTNGAILCTPDAVDFGRVTPGVTATATVTCENAVSEPVSLTGWQLTVSTPGEFQVAPFGGERVLAAGERFSVPVRFTPTVAGVGTRLQGSLLVRGRNPVASRDLEPAQVTLLGTGGGPDILVVPQSLAFGPVAVGTTKRRRLLIANVGFDALAVEGVEVEGDGFVAERSAVVIGPGADAVVTVRYTPTAVGDSRGRIRIRSNDEDEAIVDVPLDGRGVDRPPCTYAITPSAVSFGIVQVLLPSNQAVRIRNTGAEDCWVSDVRVAAGGSPYFAAAVDGPEPMDGQWRLAPGESMTTVISYTPEQAGRHDAHLELYVSSPTEPNPQVDLTGFGSTTALLVSPNTIDFGRVGVGCSTRSERVAIYNTGAVSTTIDRIERPASVSGEFVLAALPSGLPGRTLPPGQAVEIELRYDAADLGPDAGVVHIFEQGQTEPYVVSLLGEGAISPVNEDRFRQLETAEVDILFVIDNSCSMSEEQASLTDNFQSFIQFAEQQVLDYQIGVVSTDAAGCPRPGAADRPSRFDQGQCGYFADGNLTESDPSWRLIRPGTLPDPETAFSVVAEQGTSGSGSELGLEAAYRALSAPLITGWNDGFLRPRAYLALVFVSDEEDQSNNALDFYVNFFRALKGFRNTSLLSASAIVGDPADQCGEVSDPGLRYIEVAERTGGVVERICTPDWARSLQNLGLSVFGFRRRFFLSNQPAPGSVEVTVDAMAVPAQGPSGQRFWTYDSTTNSVTFSPLNVPEPGSEIVVTYRAECL